MPLASFQPMHWPLGIGICTNCLFQRGAQYLLKLIYCLVSESLYHMVYEISALNPNGQITLMEAVPVRLTPNLQEYFTENGVEGVLVPAVHALAEVLAVPEVTLEDEKTFQLFSRTLASMRPSLFVMNCWHGCSDRSQPIRREIWICSMILVSLKPTELMNVNFLDE